MFVFFLLGMILCQQVVPNAGSPTRVDAAGTEMESVRAAFEQSNNIFSERSAVPGVAGLHNYAMDQTIHINSPLICFPSDFASGNNPPITHAPEVVSEVSTTATNGDEALRDAEKVEETVFRVFNSAVSWDEARRACIDKGGHLAIIRTNSEAESIKQSMVEKSVVVAWVGYHDLFEEGNFVTVLDEPMARTGWGRWWTSDFSNPDSFGDNQNCVTVVQIDGIGLDDDSCDSTHSFICKI